MEVPRYIINLGHTLVIAPSIGYLGYKSYKEEPIEISRNIGILLIIISIIIVLYHGYTFFKVSYPAYKENKQTSH